MRFNSKITFYQEQEQDLNIMSSLKSYKIISGTYHIKNENALLHILIVYVCADRPDVAFFTGKDLTTIDDLIFIDNFDDWCETARAFKCTQSGRTFSRFTSV